MSTLSATTVTTGNATTDHTISTGNTNAGDIVLYSNGYGIVLSGNLTANTLTLSPNGNIVVSNSSANTLTLSSAGVLSVTSVNTSTINVTSSVTFENDKNLYWKTVNTSALVGFRQQVDDNFVFYSTNTAYGARPIWSIFANSITSNVNFSVPINVNGNVGIATNTLTLGTSSIAANGYSRLPNGLLMQWGNISASVNNTTTNALTFPTAFTTFYSASVTLLNATSVATTNPGIAATITANSTTQLTWRTTSTAAAASATIYWWAIGV